MTLEEKAGLLGGGDFWHTKAVERLGIPAFMVSDGPHGLRKQDKEADHAGINDSIKAVCFPAACATASSFDTELVRRMGEAIGKECQAEDVAVILGPAVNIKRSPLCGRNFEYFSEDPYLAGKMAAAFIDGVQSHHVGTSLKHFAANNQESYRMNVSVEADERTLREIYLKPFEIAVKESQPKTVMCSYNKINGVYSSDNRWLLTDVLREDFGFEGAVVTDWGAVDDRVQGVRAGLDLEMPGPTPDNDARIVRAVENGELDETLVDEAVERLLRILFDFADNRERQDFDRERDHREAVAIEKECAVLLKNDGALPLKNGDRVVYIGEFAVKPRYQGGGSSHINSSQISDSYAEGTARGRNITYVKGFPADRDFMAEEDLEAAVEAAKEADVAVIFAGLPDVIESEAYDRTDMKLPECQEEMIRRVAEVNSNTVVVLHNGAPVEAPWADRVNAVLEMYLGGQGVGEATDAILYGETNPSGHLAETFPVKLSDTPAYLNFPGDGKTVNYAEGVYVGYRYYDAKEMPVRWAFGHGLSYTTFEIGGMELDKDAMSDGESIKVSVNVKNTGDMTGKEVVQLYVSDRNGTHGRPPKELKDFAKVELTPGEEKRVGFEVKSGDLAYYSEALGDWYAPSGRYMLQVGNSSDNISCTAEFGFRTAKHLPMKIGADTTLGELLSDDRTRPVIERLAGEAAGFLTGAQNDEEDSEGGLGAGTETMGLSMMKFMPLKSLASFGLADDESLGALVKSLQEALR